MLPPFGAGVHDSSALWRWRSRCPCPCWRGREAKPDHASLGYLIGPWRTQRRRENEKEERTEKRDEERRSDEREERRDEKEESQHIEFGSVHCAWVLFFRYVFLVQLKSNSKHGVWPRAVRFGILFFTLKIEFLVRLNSNAKKSV